MIHTSVFRIFFSTDSLNDTQSELLPLVDKKYTEFKVVQNMIEITPSYGKPFAIDMLKDKSDYCVGPSWLRNGDLQVPIKMHIYLFKDPCHGKKPCIR